MPKHPWTKIALWRLENKIGSARKLVVMKTVPKPHVINELADDFFWPGIS